MIGLHELRKGVVVGSMRGFLSVDFFGHYDWFVQCTVTGIHLDETLTSKGAWRDVRAMLAGLHGCAAENIDRDISATESLWDDFRADDEEFWNACGKCWREGFGPGWAMVCEAYAAAVTDADISVEQHKRIIALEMAPYLAEAARSSAKRGAIADRRRDFQSRRPDLLLAILDRGDPHICAARDCVETNNLTIDHILPLSRGGTDDLTNLQLLCRACNSRKGNRFAPQESEAA